MASAVFVRVIFSRFSLPHTNLLSKSLLLSTTMDRPLRKKALHDYATLSSSGIRGVATPSAPDPVPAPVAALIAAPAPTPELDFLSSYISQTIDSVADCGRRRVKYPSPYEFSTVESVFSSAVALGLCERTRKGNGLLISFVCLKALCKTFGKTPSELAVFR